MRALVTVGNYAFPDPSTYSANTSTIVDSSRNALAVMIGSVIRDDVAKIEMTWKYLSAEDWSRILKCFRLNSNGQFVNLVTFYNQDLAGWVTKEMYISDRSSGMWRRNPQNGDVMGWTNCSLNLIEV